MASGALYLKSRTPLRPRIFGGGQEAGRRAGTQDLRTQLAFAAVDFLRYSRRKFYPSQNLGRLCSVYHHIRRGQREIGAF